MMVLESSRLRLSLLSDSDADFILELLNEPPFIANIGDKGVRTIADACAYLVNGPLASYAQHGFGLYRVASLATDEPLGICGILKRDVLDHPDLGYAFLQRHWGQGYAIEATAAIMKYARKHLKLETIVAITSLDNRSSIRVLEKLGFDFDSIVTLAGAKDPSRIFKSVLSPVCS